MKFNAQAELRLIRMAENGSQPFSLDPRSRSQRKQPNRKAKPGRCMVGLDPNGRSAKRGGKRCYHYLGVIRVARANHAYFYVCNSGDHWHVTSSPYWGAYPGTVS